MTGRRNAKIAAVLAVVALLVVAQRLGILAQFHDPAQVKQSLVALGGWGYVVFIVSYALLQPFGIPGTVFVVAAALIWPWPVAFALSMVGTMAASVVGFSFARFVARDWIEERIPARFRRYDEALSRRALPTVVVLRFVFWMPPLLHAFFGVSKVRFSTHFWGSLLGYVVPLLAMSYFGEKLFGRLANVAGSTWAGVAALAVMLGVFIWLLRRRRTSRAREVEAPAVNPES